MPRKKEEVSVEIIGWELIGTVLIKKAGKVNAVQNIKAQVMEADFGKTLESITKEALSQISVENKG